MATLLNLTFALMPEEICKYTPNILISLGPAQETICCRPNDHLEWDDNICRTLPLIYPPVRLSRMICAALTFKNPTPLSGSAVSGRSSVLQRRNKTGRGN